MRCTLIASTVALLGAASLTAQTVRTIQNNGPVGNRYDIVIVGDGYQAHEETKFDGDAAASIARLFRKPSYGTYQSYFNVHTVFRASNESGADQPDVNPPIVRDTVYDATYNYGGTTRALYIRNTSQAAADSRLAPDVEGRVIVLVNDTRYGGCAETFAVSYTGPDGPEVQAHEFGHSFARLADEYEYGRSGTYSGPEPPEANLTADPTGQAKWPAWLGVNGVSAHEGAGYYLRGLWRPKIQCLMRSLYVRLCDVCNEQIVLQSYVEVDPIENRSPTASTVSIQRPNSQTFSITSLVPGNASIVWRVDGVQVASGSTSFTFDSIRFGAGRRALTVTVRDQTSFVRSDPNNLLTSSTSWNVDVQSTLPGAYWTYGAGCPGSAATSSTCLRVNANGTSRGFGSQPSVTYAIRGSASSDRNISGIELYTESQRSGNVLVAIELYTADASGAPATRVATGTMDVGSAPGWYSGSFTAPHLITAGSQFFVAYVTPAASIGASVVHGTETPYFRNDGANGSWNGPLTGYAWAYRITCESPSGGVPRLTAQGTPEIGLPMDIVLDRAVANAPSTLLFGDSSSTWRNRTLPFDMAAAGAPGCYLLTTPGVLESVQTDAAGRAVYTLRVPNDPTLVQANFFNQFVVLDPNANALGVVFSNAGAGRVGRP